MKILRCSLSDASMWRNPIALWDGTAASAGTCRNVLSGMGAPVKSSRGGGAAAHSSSEIKSVCPESQADLDSKLVSRTNNRQQVGGGGVCTVSGRGQKRQSRLCLTLLILFTQTLHHSNPTEEDSAAQISDTGTTATRGGGGLGAPMLAGGSESS